MAETGRQRSEERANQQGVAALDNALTRIRSSRSNVEGITSSLTQGYQGADGGEFGKLLGDWEKQCGIIEKNLRDMVDALQNTGKYHKTHQQGVQDQIASQAAKSAVFDRLTG